MNENSKILQSIDSTISKLGNSITQLKKVKMSIVALDKTKISKRERVLVFICKYYNCATSDIIIDRANKNIKIKPKHAPAFALLCYLLQNYCDMGTNEIVKFVQNNRQRVHAEIKLLKNPDLRDVYQKQLNEDRKVIEKIICEIL